MDSLILLKNGVEAWNQRRSRHPDESCNLTGQDLSGGYFYGGNFSQVNLSGANLRQACLIGADFRGADLTGADLTGAYLAEATFYGANLSYADLSGANLDCADLRRVNLLRTQIVHADICTAYLPDPQIDPYADEVVHLLAQRNLSAQRQPKQGKRAFIKAAIRTRIGGKQQSPQLISTHEQRAARPVNPPPALSDLPAAPEIESAVRVRLASTAGHNDGSIAVWHLDSGEDSLLYQGDVDGLVGAGAIAPPPHRY